MKRNTSKIHVVVDALGSPVRWLLTGGEVADITQAKSLLDGLKTDAVLADKGYDADALIDSIQVAGATAVIPPNRNRVVQRSYDRHLYKERNLVERFFNRIKQFRRIATRYEKLARKYLSFLNLVCTYICIILFLTRPIGSGARNGPSRPRAPYGQTGRPNPRWSVPGDPANPSAPGTGCPRPSTILDPPRFALRPR